MSEVKVKDFRIAQNFLPEIKPLPIWEEPENWNEDIVETAGFVPLEVRFKQMEQAGIQAQFLQSEFTSFDVRDMYLNHPEFDLNGDEDIEEAMEKIKLRQAWIEHVKAEKAKLAAEEVKGEQRTAPAVNKPIKRSAGDEESQEREA